MGYDAACTIRIDGKTARGTAWLEHKDLVFRGSFRLAIPLKAITTAAARDGTLVVSFEDRTARFEMGAAAAKWADRIMNPPSRLDKLGVKPGMTVLQVAFDDKEFAAEVTGRGATLVRRTKPGAADMVFYGANDRRDLAKLPALVKRIDQRGAIWVIRPKGVTSITEAEVMAAGKRAGLVDVKVVSFSDTHTAEKFVVPRSSRRPEGPRKASRRIGVL